MEPTESQPATTAGSTLPNPADVSTLQRRIDQNSACGVCREAKLKCSRGQPCMRCGTQGLACRYPSVSRRGRKPGSTNKPDSVQSFLSRLDKSSVREEVLAALAGQFPDTTGLTLPRAEQSAPQPPDQVSSQQRPPTDHGNVPLNYTEPTNAVDDRIYAPLEIIATTVKPGNISPQHRSSIDGAEGASGRETAFSVGRGSYAGSGSTFRVSDRLASYFGTSIATTSDWEELARDSPQSTLQGRPSIYDLLSSRLLDDSDAAHIFHLFFELRNPVVGLLDPVLHTPQYVYSQSFTLFSVVCALGCALSDKPRDRLLYPTLAVIADANVQWSIAASVKSIEIVQALILFAYWGPAHEKQRDDPYWLRLSHATQLARELHIGRSRVVRQRAMLLEGTDPGRRERLIRNMQRTWLYVFIADKSFGITTGRATCFSWKEIPNDVSVWWQKPGASTHDRMICGIVEMRIAVVKSLERRKIANSDRLQILEWQQDAVKTLTDMRKKRCEGHGPPFSPLSLPVLAFYIDYTMLLINTHAAGDLIPLGQHETTLDLKSISQESVEIAFRLLDLIMSDPTLLALKSGLHNCQLVMVCHAVTEILNAIKRGARADIAQTASVKIRATAKHLQDVASTLPASSWAQIYADVAQVLVEKLDDVCSIQVGSVALDDNDWTNFVPNDGFSTNWWGSVGGGPTELVDWINMGADPELDGMMI